MPHALLLTGPGGQGQRQFAEYLAAGLLCHGDTSKPCGRCKSCVLLEAETHPDIFRVEPEETGRQIRVESIRNLIGFIQLKSQYGRHKIAVIDPAEAMNRTSANTLLKTLEEPPADSLLILISHQPSALPVTIRSRCQKINFPASRPDAALQWLADRLGVDRGQASELLLLAGGSPLHAVQLQENDTAVRQRQVLKDLLRLAPESDIVKLARTWQGYGTREVFRWLAGFLAAMIRYRASDGGGQGNSAGSLEQDLQQIANQLDLSQLVSGYDLALQNYRGVSGVYNLNPAGLLEEFLVYWQSLKR